MVHSPLSVKYCTSEMTAIVFITMWLTLYCSDSWLLLSTWKWTDISLMNGSLIAFSTNCSFRFSAVVHATIFFKVTDLKKNNNSFYWLHCSLHAARLTDSDQGEWSMYIYIYIYIYQWWQRAKLSVDDRALELAPWQEPEAKQFGFCNVCKSVIPSVSLQLSKCEMRKSVGAGRKCQVPRRGGAGRLFRLAGHLGRTEKRGRGRVCDQAVGWSGQRKS